MKVVTSSNPEIGASGDSRGCSSQLEDNKESNLEVAGSVGGLFQLEEVPGSDQQEKKKTFLI